MYKQLIVSLYDKDGIVVNTGSFPCGTFVRDGQTIKLYGADSGVWGSVKANGSYTSIICNRTSANTSKLAVFGVK